MVSIYFLSDPRDPLNIRYVGKTSKDLRHRLSIHLSSTSLSNKTHKNNWIKSLLILDIIPIITLIEEVSDECWVEREIFWIKYYRDSGFNLTNSTDGGEGMLNPSEDTRNKLSFASSGDRNPNYGKKRTKEINDKINEVRVMKHSDETKKKLSGYSKARTHSEETKDKIRNKLIGREVTEETRIKMSESHIGYIPSDETRLKLSEACSGEKNGFYGKKHTDETKIKLSELNKGKIIGDETRKNMSIAQSGEKNGFYGKKHTEETKRKMAESRRKKKEEKEMEKLLNESIL